MLIRYKYFLKLITLLITILIIAKINLYPIETLGRIHNQYLEKQYSKMFDSMTKSLILLTVTGDKRYKNKELENIYKELQIIHILVISAGNILLFLNFIHLFIYRIKATNLLMTLIFIYFYGRFISMPETFIRAIQTIFITQFLSTVGLKISKTRLFLILVCIYTLTFYFLDLGESYRLSAIYSSVILISNNLSSVYRISNIPSFLILQFLLTLTSSILFSLDRFSIICTSFLANIFISLLYDIAIYLAYVTYLLPNFLIEEYLGSILGYLFKLVFMSLNLIKELTYNVCYAVVY